MKDRKPQVNIPIDSPEQRDNWQKAANLAPGFSQFPGRNLSAWARDALNRQAAIDIEKFSK